MRILVAGSGTPFGDALAHHLAARPGHSVHAVHSVQPADLAGIDAIVHAACFDPPVCPDVSAEQELLMQATRDTYRLCEAALAAGVERIIVIGSLGIFAAYPEEYLIDEMWRPRPRPAVADLAPYLCEKVVREFVRAGGVNGVGLRFCPIGDDPERNTRLADALQAVERSLAVPFAAPGYRWHVIHVASSPRFLARDARTMLGLERVQEGARSQESEDRRPEAEDGDQRSDIRHPVSGIRYPASRVPHPASRIMDPASGIQTVCVFGAGGPVGAAIAPHLCRHYTVRFTDIHPLEHFLGKPKSPVWPCWDKGPATPHEWRLCDVTDFEQVRAAMDGCDAVINLTVNRDDVELAFRINVIGTYTIMKAALECRPQRIIQTGPIARVNGYEGDYRYEYDITADAPLRPGTLLYPHTKFLGHLVADAFARESGLDVMTFLVSRLRPHDRFDDRDDNVMISFSTAMEDLGPAFLRGLAAPRMPHPNEKFYLCAELPMGKYSAGKTERLLGWKAQHTFEEFYRRPL